MAIQITRSRLVVSLAGCLLLGSSATAAEYTVEDVLRFQPVQKDVQCDRPEKADLAKCTLKTEKKGWIVRDPAGQLLRKFTDTDGDGQVDQFSYFKDGVEVYRDIDSNFDTKADQYRWLNTAGIRWGIDTNQDGKIDYWQAISAEEVSAEVVASLKDRDRARFERLLLTPKELKSLGLGTAKVEEVTKRIDSALNAFMTLANQKGAIAADTKWVSFGGTQPGTVPAGTEDSTADLVVYENVAAMIESGGKAKALTVGTMVKVADKWRLVDAPQMADEKSGDLENRFVFFSSERDSAIGAGQVGAPNARMQELIAEIQKLPDTEYGRRADLLEKLAAEADTPDLRAQWYKQAADTLGAAIQTSNFGPGVDKLKALEARLQADPKDAELAFYVQFRRMTAEHGQALSAPNTNFAQVQTKWIEDLEQFVKEAGKYPDSADAMLELAISQEFAGAEPQAIKWYSEIIKSFPEAPVHKKALGAKLRLSSLGNRIPLAGKTIDGKQYDVKVNGKDKVVLIQYWATWCEPCKADMPLLRELKAKYKNNFEVVGICLDSNKSDMTAFLKENNTPWPQLFEEGGLDNRYASELGIQTLPTMILLDKQGKVINRNVRAGEIETELKQQAAAK